MGRQTRVALLNLGGFWVLGLPGGALLAFTFDLGVYGIWWGFVMGLALISLLYLWALSKLDFEDEARRALLNACTDQKLEQAWEETLEQEKIGREGGVEAAALVGVVGEGHDDFERV
jgi:MATE family multidrug resistance protein